jgi:hypothetical protein
VRAFGPKPRCCRSELSNVTNRDDAVCFGLDRREFGETVWHFVDKPRPAIIKMFFVRTGSDEPRYIDGLVNLSCAKGPSVRYVLTYGRELLPSDQSASSIRSPVSIRLSDKPIQCFPQEHPKFYIRSTQVAVTALLTLRTAQRSFCPEPSSDARS